MPCRVIQGSRDISQDVGRNWGCRLRLAGSHMKGVLPGMIFTVLGIN